MKLPRDVSGSEAARALRRAGFMPVRQTDAPPILRRANRTVVVPQHNPIKPGTLKGLMEQAGLSVEEFAELL